MEEIEYQLQDAIDEIQHKMDESIHELESATNNLRDVTKETLQEINKANLETERIAREVRESHKLLATSDLRNEIDELSKKLDRLMKVFNIC